MATTAKQTELDPLDYLAIDALLDDEEKAIRDTVRQWVRDRVLPQIALCHFRSCRVEGLGQAQSDAAAGAGYENDFSRE